MKAFHLSLLAADALRWGLVFLTAVVLDVVWAKYNVATVEGRRLQSSLLAATLMLLGAFNIESYTQDFWLVVPAMAGAFLGTYVGVKKR